MYYEYIFNVRRKLYIQGIYIVSSYFVEWYVQREIYTCLLNENEMKNKSGTIKKH